MGEVLTVIRELAEDGMTCVLVTHEMRFAAEVSDEVVFTEAGLVVEQGPAARLFGNPQQERTRAFLRRALGASLGSQSYASDNKVVALPIDRFRFAI